MGGKMVGRGNAQKMGVYVFRCGEWLKVGHHQVTRRRPNVYYRVAGRGFESVTHPKELEGKLSIQDVELVAWYPSLTKREEMKIHRMFGGKVGEFHRGEKEEEILRECDKMGEKEEVGEKEKKVAVAWSRLLQKVDKKESLKVEVKM